MTKDSDPRYKLQVEEYMFSAPSHWSQNGKKGRRGKNYSLKIVRWQSFTFELKVT